MAAPRLSTPPATRANLMSPSWSPRARSRPGRGRRPPRPPRLPRTASTGPAAAGGLETTEAAGGRRMIGHSRAIANPGKTDARGAPAILGAIAGLGATGDLAM